VRAGSLEQAIEILVKRGEAARVLMGGTDLLVRVRDGAVRPGLLVDIKHLPGMRDIGCDAETGLTVGAAVTMNELARHPDVRAHYPLLAEAAHFVGSYQLRNRATVGGNLCNGSPCADTTPATLVLEGRMVLHGPQGAREVPAREFFVGPGETALQAGELVTAICYPVPPAGAAGRYLKLGRSQVGDLAIVSAAIFGFPDTTAPSGHRFRVALGSVAPVVVRARDAESLLAESPPSEQTFALAAEKAVSAAQPIDDVRASAAYRREMVRALTLRGLRAVWAELG
jgi:carbon-monoxide dehydrogenase medium subunit